MAIKWKSRGHYGLILFKKIRNFEAILEEMGENLKEIGLPSDNQIKLFLDVSKAQDYSISVQIANIKAIEEFETLEKLETWKNELLAIRGKSLQEAVLRTKWQY